MAPVATTTARPSSLALVRYAVAFLLSTRRILLVPPALGLATWKSCSDLVRALEETPVSANATDAALRIFASSEYLVGVLALGFVLLTADFIPRAAGSGALQLTAVRSVSHLRWWLAHTAALGIAALILAGSAMLAALLVGLARLPDPLGPAMPAEGPLDPQNKLIPVPMGVPAGIPRSLLLVGIVLLVAAVLWTLSLLAATVALLRSHPIVAALPVLAWTVIERFAHVTSDYELPALGLIDPFAHLSYQHFAGLAHFGVLIIPPRVPLETVAILGIEVSVLLAMGAFILRRRDLPTR